MDLGQFSIGLGTVICPGRHPLVTQPPDKEGLEMGPSLLLAGASQLPTQGTFTLA
jgi:hypothetical protein